MQRNKYLDRFILCFGILLLISGCKGKILELNQEKHFFDLKGFVEMESERLQKQNLPVLKKVVKGEKKEQKNLSNLVWKEELLPITESDLNRPAWKSQYKADTSLFENSILITYTGLKVTSKDYTWAKVTWNPIRGTNHYQLRYKNQRDSTWIIVDSIQGTTFDISNLAPCNSFIIQVSAYCANIKSPLSSEVIFKTEGCDDPYCYSYGAVIVVGVVVVLLLLILLLLLFVAVCRVCLILAACCVCF